MHLVSTSILRYKFWQKSYALLEVFINLILSNFLTLKGQEYSLKTKNSWEKKEVQWMKIEGKQC